MIVYKLKEINIKTFTYYYWNDLININDLNLRNIAIYEKWYKDISILLLWL